MIVCRRWKESLHLLTGGQLEESSKPAVLRHMEQCEKCRSFYQDLQKIEATLRSPVREKDFLPRLEIQSIVESSLRAAERKPIPVRRRITFFHGPNIAWGFAAAVLIFLCGYSFHELAPKKISSPQIASAPDSGVSGHSTPGAFTRKPAKIDSELIANARPAKSSPAPLSQEDLADRHYAIANRLLKKHNFAGASAALQKSLALHAAKREKAMLDLAYCYSMLGQPQRAMPIYRAVARGSRNPKSVETAYNRIDSLLEMRSGAYEEAEEGAFARNIPAGLLGQRDKYYVVQMPIRIEDSAKVDCLLEQFRREVPRSAQVPGMSPQIINVSSPWIAANE